MKYRRTQVASALATLLLWSHPAGAVRQAPSQASELYHIHIVKAAAGKLPELIESYKNAPGPDKDQPQFTPIILRHRQGGEWDLMVITPAGNETTISAAAVPPEVQKWNQRNALLAEWHGDTFTIGPAWDVVQKALVPSAGAETAVYVVSDYRAIPGHRQQLRENLEGAAQPGASATVLFSHVEGAPWNFLAVSRYASWADLGTPPPAGGEGQGIAVREHMAVHHDTVASYIAGGQPIR